MGWSLSYCNTSLPWMIACHWCVMLVNQTDLFSSSSSRLNILVSYLLIDIWIVTMLLDDMGLFHNKVVLEFVWLRLPILRCCLGTHYDVHSIVRRWYLILLSIIIRNSWCCCIEGLLLLLQRRGGWTIGEEDWLLRLLIIWIMRLFMGIRDHWQLGGI